MAVKDRSSLQNGFDAVGAIETNTSNLVTAARIVLQLDNISDSSVSRLDDPYPRYAGSVSGTNAIAITITNDYPSAYSSAGNIPIKFIPANANNGTPTGNINALGALNFYKLDQTQVTTANFFITTLSYEVRFNTDADGAGTDTYRPQTEVPVQDV